MRSSNVRDVVSADCQKKVDINISLEQNTNREGGKIVRRTWREALHARKALHN